MAVFRRFPIPTLVAGALIAPWPPGATPARAQDETPNVMLILDSSRSMWGQIDGVNKVVSARNAVGAAIKRYGARVNLGLVAYGHRESSGCSDIEVVYEPGRHDAKKVAETVNGIMPKGSTPISRSLVAAAEAVRYKDRRASLVLIADGLDNCSADPCATASELEQQGQDLTIHAIAFDARKQEELAALSCIAENTGGTFAGATNESELGEATQAAFEAATTQPMPKVSAAEVASDKPQEQSSPQDAAAGDATQKSEPLTTASTSETPAAEDSAASPPQTAREVQQALATDGDSVPVTLAARTVEGGAIIKAGLVWWIYRNEKTRDGKYELLETLRDATPTAALRPGSYRVAATYGKVNLIKDIEVSRGKALQETFILNAGGLRLNAVTLKGKTIPPNSVRYDIFADETESDQFGNRKIVLRDAKPGVVLRLNAGAYHVVSTYGDANAIVRADVTVEPGRLTDATMNHSAAKVTFKLVTQPGGEALADTQWNILTPGGDIVKESAGALPTHILAGGNYSVLARHQGKNFTRKFSVEPGETKQIEVVIR